MANSWSTYPYMDGRNQAMVDATCGELPPHIYTYNQVVIGLLSAPYIKRYSPDTLSVWL